MVTKSSVPLPSVLIFVFSFLSAIPIVEANTYVVSIDYSPLVGGFAVVLNDGRAAFLTASTLKFDPNVSATCISGFFLCSR